MSAVVQASDRRQGQIQADEQLQGPWLLVCPPVTEGSSHGCAHGSGGQRWASLGSSITSTVWLLLLAPAFLPCS